MNMQSAMECNLETGRCEPVSQEEETIQVEGFKKITILYFTDPICSSCWAIEPALRRFKHQYGKYLDIQYFMGGLLPNWNGFADKANGIGQPTDVAHHWDEVGEYSGMSIDGDIWRENPMPSSFPPSIAFKAIQQQNEQLAIDFLRKMRELLFLEKQNICETDVLIKAAEMVGADVDSFLRDYESEETKTAFEKELAFTRNLSVRGFPTFIFVDHNNQGIRISGSSGFENYVKTLQKLIDKPLKPQPLFDSIEAIVRKYGYLSTEEIKALYDHEQITFSEAMEQEKSKLREHKQKFGSFWSLKD